MQEPPQPLPTSHQAPDPPPLPEPGEAGPQPAAAGGGDEGWRGLLHNRFILGGLGVLVVLLLTTIVLVAVGGGNDEGGNTVVVKTGTPPQATVLPTEGLPGTTRRAVTMYNGPDQTYAIVGLIPKGATVSVIGRSEDSTWLQVYPPSSKLPGWIQASAVDVDGRISELRIASPGAGPDIAVPTSGVPVEENPDFVYTPAQIETPEPTAGATEPPSTRDAPTRTPRPRTPTPPQATPPPGTPGATVTGQ